MARYVPTKNSITLDVHKDDEFHQAFTDIKVRDDSSKTDRNLASVRAIADKRGILVHDVDAGRPCIKCGIKCPGFSLHFWRKICLHCKCPRMDHDIQEYESHRSNFENIYFPQDLNHVDKFDLLNWIPKGITKQLIDAYLSSLPKDKNPLEPRGRIYRNQQFAYQLPKHDTFVIEHNKCNLSENEFEQVRAFIQLRKERISRATIRANFTELAWNCSGCTKPLKIGDAAIMLDESARSIFFHAHCFICSDCKELLVDLIYFYSNGKLYCGRHHAETIKPRCAACDELIFSKEFTKAEGLNWHLQHFCCIDCDTLLGGKKYMVADNGHPYCLICFANLYSKGCATCGNFIRVDDPRLSHGEFDWHGSPLCFKCHYCSTSLLGSPFLPKGSFLYCSKICYKSRKNI